MLDHVEIVRVEEIGALRVLRHGERAIGAVRLDQLVAPAAGLGAVAAVAVPPVEIGGQHTPPGIRHTHCAVHKCLQLQFFGCVGANIRDLLHRQLPRQHRAGSAHIVQTGGGFAVDYPKLGGHMQRTAGRIPLRQRHHAQIGDDQRIHPHILPFFQKRGQLPHFFVARQNVAGDIHLDPAAVGIRYGNAQLRL